MVLVAQESKSSMGERQRENKRKRKVEALGSSPRNDGRVCGGGDLRASLLWEFEQRPCWNCVFPLEP